MTSLTDKQLEQIYAIVERFCRENNWPFDEHTKLFIQFMDLMKDTLPKEYYFCISTTTEGNIAGLVVGQIYEHPFSKVKIATEWFVWSSVPGVGRQMLEEFEKWAKENGADVVYATAPNSKVDHWLEKQDYQFKEKAYIKWL